MIVNDRDFGGKCYGFVTFTNPRAAVNAIKDMDGRTIGGRIVRVNEVKSKSLRTTFTRDNRFRDRDRDRDRETDSRERDGDKDESRERPRARARDRDQDRVRDRDRDLRFRNRTGAARYISSPIKRKPSPKSLYSTRKRILHEKGRSPRGRSLSGSSSGKKWDVSVSPSPRRSERMQADENSNRKRAMSASKDKDLEKIKEELEKAIQRRDDLKHEIARMEEESDKKSLLISEMQKKSQKLEESIATTRKATLQRETQFRKMQNCCLQIRDYTNKLKSSEEELQLLVDASILDMNGIEERGNEEWYSTHSNGTA